MQAFRPRWHSEDDASRELKEGWVAIARLALGRTTLICLAFNFAHVYRLQARNLCEQ